MYTGTCTCVYAFTCMHVRVRVHVGVCVCANVSVVSVRTCMYVCGVSVYARGSLRARVRQHVRM